MFKEVFFSGYCRCIDGSRTVCVEIEDRDVSVDCNYGCCPYEADCAIAKSIRETEEE